MCQNLFLSCNFKKESLAQEFFCEFCRIFNNTFFKEHLWMTTSIQQQLLALYLQLYIAGNFQGVTRHWSGKKSSIYLKDFTNLDFSYTDIYIYISIYIYIYIYIYTYIYIFIFFDKYLFSLSVTQSICYALSSQQIFWLGDNLFDQF